MDKKIANFHNTRDILNKYNIRLNKNLGQHFLIDNNIMRKIIEVSELKGDEFVLEIGSGIGSLTQYLLHSLNKGRLLSIEKDSRFIEILKDLFDVYDNLDILNMDILQVNWEQIINNYK